MKTRYFELLYYEETAETPSYSFKPRQHFSVEKLARGQPYWYENQGKIWKKRKLVIADWTAINWSHRKTLLFCEKISELLNQGFELYAWQDSKTIAITSDNVSEFMDPNFRKRITLEFPDVVKNAAINEHGLSHKETDVLDDWAVKWLLSGESEPPVRGYDFRDRRNIPARRDKIFRILKEAEPTLDYIYDSEFSTPAIEFYSLQDFWSDLKEFIDVPLIHIEMYRRFIQSKDTNFDSSGSTTSRDRKFDLSKQTKLESIELTDNIYSDDIILQLLQNSPLLESLSLTNMSSETLNLDSQKDLLNNLNELSIDNDSGHIVKKMLQYATNLRSLSIKHIKPDVSNDILSLDCQYPYLESLILEDVANAHILIPHFIKHGKIKSLVIGHGKSLVLNHARIAINFSGCDLSLLHTLDLSDCMITSEAWRELSFAKAIKKLKFLSCILFKPLNLEHFDLLSLEVVAITDAENMSENDFVNLLNGASNIKSFELDFVKNRIQRLRGPELLSLEFIRLCNVNITADAVHDLLKRARNIKRFEFIKHFELEIKIDLTHIDLEDCDFDSLESVNLSNLRMPDRAVMQFIMKANNLTSFTFPNEKKIGIDEIARLRSNPDELAAAIKANKYIPSGADADSGLSDATDSSESEFDSLPTTDPIFNPDHNNDFRPTPPSFQFKYKKNMRTLNQAMIINQLSQYLTRLGEAHYVYKLQDGICSALAHYYNDKPNFNYTVKLIRDWDGGTRSCTPQLHDIFNELKEYAIRYNVYPKSRTVSYIGDNVSLIFKQNGPFILENTWHAVTVKRSATPGKWILYDPNFSYGEKELTENELLAALNQNSLGSLIFIEGATSIPPAISNVQTFIQEGGLLAIDKCSNASEIMRLLPDAALSSMTADNLQGLIRRDLNAKPAWMVGLTNPISRKITLQLLYQFMQHHSTDYVSRLIKSLDALTQFEKHDFIASQRGILHQLLEAHPPVISQADVEFYISLINQISDVVHTIPLAVQYKQEQAAVQHKQEQPAAQDYQEQPEVKRYRELLEAKRSAVSAAIPSLAQYCQDLTNGIDKKRLVTFTQSRDLYALQLALMHHCQATNRPVYYIHSPDDVVCASPYVERLDDKTGALRKGHGGPLHDFLTKPYDKSNPPIIIVNYDNFEAEDIVNLNSLIDKRRRADGTDVPESATIIGLINTNKPGCYKEADFLTRFDKREACPISSLPIEPIYQDKLPDEGTTVINLCHAADWESRLLGGWTFEGDKLVFTEGLLKPALASGKPIEIHNGLWDSVHFQHFWLQAVKLGKIISSGREITFPKTTKLIRHDGYDLTKLFNRLVLDTSLNLHAAVLNPATQGEFFSQHVCKKNKLNTLLGRIAAAKDSTLSIQLTRPLTLDQFADVLLECEKYNVTLHCHCLCQSLLEELSARPSIAITLPEIIEHTRLFQTNDMDAFVAEYTRQEPDQQWKVLDISECDVSDLLTHLDGKIDKETAKCTFTETEKVLVTAFRNKENIILKGRFSKSLIDGLAPFLLERHANADAKGKLVIVCDDTANFNYAPVTRSQITVAQKAMLLNDRDRTLLSERFTDSELSKMSYVELQAHLADAKANFSKNSGWEGMRHLPSKISIEPFDLANCAAKAKAHTDKRLQLIDDRLAHSPCVLIMGLTGVGKTTFVNDCLKHQPNIIVYTDKKEWALARSANPHVRHIFFGDEAGIAPGEWSELEGLYNEPPGILIDGVYYPLTEQHKAVLATNPLSYGGERKLAPFFERHGGAVVFEPLPAECIYQDTLLPIFQGSSLFDKLPEIASHLLNVYRFLCECSTTEVLMTPRDLEMMALLIQSHQLRFPDDNLDAVTRHYAYMIVKQVVPDVNRKEFDSLFKPVASITPNTPATSHANYVITPSRQALHQQLLDLIHLQSYRRSPHAMHKKQRLGGLGGLIIEGNSGIGKSELVIQTLVAEGYQEAKLDHPVPEKPFYRIEMSMALEVKEQILLTAFKQGAIVVIDEINSGPMMEKLLNKLLAGEAPDNQPPEYGKLLVIGTKNPERLAGRRKATTALSRRTVPASLSDYTNDEMVSILSNMGLDLITAHDMVSALNRTSPKATFRELENLAKDELKARAPVSAAVPVSAASAAAAPVMASNSIATLFKSLTMTLFGVSSAQPDARKAHTPPSTTSTKAKK